MLTTLIDYKFHFLSANYNDYEYYIQNLKIMPNIVVNLLIFG